MTSKALCVAAALAMATAVVAEDLEGACPAGESCLGDEADELSALQHKGLNQQMAPLESGIYIGKVKQYPGASFYVTNPKAKVVIGKFENCAGTSNHVPCGFGTGTECSGNQCCPRAEASGWKTFKCPSADSSFNGCESNIDSSRDSWNEEMVSKAAIVKRTQILVLNAEGGSQNNVEGDLTIGTYECIRPPSALQQKSVEDGIYIGHVKQYPGAGFVVTNPNAKVVIGKFKNCAGTKNHLPCGFGTGIECSGNQCCPRTAASGGKTFKCPSADSSFNGCESNLDSSRDTWNEDLVSRASITKRTAVLTMNAESGSHSTVEGDLTIGTYECM